MMMYKIGVKANYHIKLEVEHRLLSLKADVATCRDRSISTRRELAVYKRWKSINANMHFSNERTKKELHWFLLKNCS